MPSRRTLAVHAGAARSTPGAPALSAPPIQQASAGLFATLEDVEGAYARGDMLYRPYGAANAAQLERAMVELEGEGSGLALAALATASGMAALHLAALAHARPGRHLVCAADVYGGTHRLFGTELPAMGVPTRLFDPRQEGSLEDALEGASMLLVETIANPSLRVADIPHLAELAHAAGAQLVVDNTFASPALCRPLSLGADIVMHSATKYLSGHSDAVGGVLVYPQALEQRVQELVVAFRPTPSPLDTWLTLRGLRTMTLRLDAACSNAIQLAAWLSAQASVELVLYPGLEGHETHAVAVRVLAGGFGGMVSFEVPGGAAGAARFCAALQLIQVMPSLADVATSISYPAGTSHRGYTAEEMEMAGVTPGLLRLSVGIEDPADIQADLEAALAAL